MSSPERTVVSGMWKIQCSVNEDSVLLRYEVVHWSALKCSDNFHEPEYQNICVTIWLHFYDKWVRFVFSGDWAVLSFDGNICSIRTVLNSQHFPAFIIYRAVWWSIDVKYFYIDGNRFEFQLCLSWDFQLFHRLCGRDQGRSVSLQMRPSPRLTNSSLNMKPHSVTFDAV